MLSAVHTDRSGRVFVSDDHGAASSDGARVGALTAAIPLPADATLVPLAGRPAIALDRRGHPRVLGAQRLALGAVLPAGHVRTQHPAYADDGSAPALDPRAYAAVAADESGALVVAAVATGPTRAKGLADAALAQAVSGAMRGAPSNRLLRQLARCAKEYACPAARESFAGGGCPLPLGTETNEPGAPQAALRREDESAPRDPVAFKVTAAEAAEIALAHLPDGRTVTFGHACDGEPLRSARLVGDAIARARAATARGTIALATNGSSAAGLRRCADAGLDAVAVRLASARSDTYDAVHRPEGYRWPDVHASLRLARERGLALRVDLLVLPGLTDREEEADALVALLGELAPETRLRLVDLAADAPRLLATLPRAAPLGMGALVDRIARELPHLAAQPAGV